MKLHQKRERSLLAKKFSNNSMIIGKQITSTQQSYNLANLNNYNYSCNNTTSNHTATADFTTPSETQQHQIKKRAGSENVYQEQFSIVSLSPQNIAKNKVSNSYFPEIQNRRETESLSTLDEKVIKRNSILNKKHSALSQELQTINPYTCTYQGQMNDQAVNTSNENFNFKISQHRRKHSTCSGTLHQAQIMGAKFLSHKGEEPMAVQALVGKRDVPIYQKQDTSTDDTESKQGNKSFLKEFSDNLIKAIKDGNKELSSLYLTGKNKQSLMWSLKDKQNQIQQETVQLIQKLEESHTTTLKRKQANSDFDIKILRTSQKTALSMADVAKSKLKPDSSIHSLMPYKIKQDNKFLITPSFTYDSQTIPIVPSGVDLTKSKIINEILASRKERQDLNTHLNQLRKNRAVTEDFMRSHLLKNGKINMETLAQINQVMQNQSTDRAQVLYPQQSQIQLKKDGPIMIVKNFVERTPILEKHKQQEIVYKSQAGADQIKSAIVAAADRTTANSTFSGLQSQSTLTQQSPSPRKQRKKSPKVVSNVPKIKIFHKPSTHLNEHPINQAIQKINQIIKLIFKQQPKEATSLPQHLLEESKLIEIQKTSKFFGIAVPKKFDSKTALREYFQSKEFIVNLKLKMNSVLYQAINQANGMPENTEKTTQRFYIGRGNNDIIVKSVLKQRSWWSQHLEEDFSEVQFMWTQWKKQKHINQLSTKQEGFKIYNRMEQNKQLTNKKGVFINMREYYKQAGEDPFQVLPLTFLVKQGQKDPEFIRFLEYYEELAKSSKVVEQERQVLLQQRIKELQQIKEQHKKQSFLPKVPKVKRSSYYSEDDSDEDDDEDEQLDIDNDEVIKDIKKRYRVHKNVWIIKPGENTNRGNGINVSADLKEIKQLVQKAYTTADKEKTYIIQKYIDHPLLIYKRKFDFRCYGLMTSINGHLKGYFYEDAYIRTSCKEFDIDNFSKFIHLTNDAVQKYSQDYGKYENGNKMSMGDFQRYLKIQYPKDNIDVWRDLMPQIRKLVTDSYRSVYGKIDPSRLNNTFELLGYDFMLDEDFRLYLIEVNTNPCLEMSCPLLARIIPEVLDNAFRIILDPIFPAPDLNNNRKCAFNEIPQEIKFTLIFDEDVDGPELKKQQQKFTGTVIEEIESDEEDDLLQDEASQDTQDTNNGVK